MYEIIDLFLGYGIPIVGAIPLLLFIFWQSKIKAYLKSNHPDAYRKIYVVEQDERRENEEWTLFSEFISEKHLELNDKVLSEMIVEFKIFRFSLLMFVLLFITNVVMSHHLKG